MKSAHLVITLLLSLAATVALGQRLSSSLDGDIDRW